MEIKMLNKETLIKYISDIEKILENNNLMNLESLIKAADKNKIFKIGNDNNRKIEVTYRPSSSGTTAITISYIDHEFGIPVEIRINYKLNYTLVILKSDEILKDFIPFTVDCLGHIGQNRIYNGTTNLREVIEDVKKALYL